MRTVETNRQMQIVSLSVIVLAIIPLVLFPEAAKVMIKDTIFKWMTSTFDFAFLAIGLAALVFLLGIAFSRSGDIVLSRDLDAKRLIECFAWC